MSPQDFRLTPEQVATLRGAATQINAARSAIDRLKKIGIDVSEQEARLAEAERIRAGLLQQFSPTGVPR